MKECEIDNDGDYVYMNFWSVEVNITGFVPILVARTGGMQLICVSIIIAGAHYTRKDNRVG